MVTANNFLSNKTMYIFQPVTLPDIAQMVERSTVDRLVLCSTHSVRKNDLSRGLNASTGRHSTFGVVVTYFPSKEVPRFRLPEGAKMVSHSKYFIALLARGRRIETCPLRKRR